MRPGCYTALVTPFDKTGEKIDFSGLEKLISFQIEYGVTGILAVGTTGESPTLSWDEHLEVIEKTAGLCSKRCACIAGTGSNNTAETLKATEHAASAGTDAVLLVDPYYNGPSSLEIRKEYISPVASTFPEVSVIPYVIPGRTGTKLLPQDIAILAENHKNISSVKEATGDLDNMRKTRECCGPDFVILSGDDALTHTMMTDSSIAAKGVISVISNIAPKAVSDLIRALLAADNETAGKLNQALTPLFSLVTVTTKEKTKWGEITCRARNPLPIKTLMQILGLPSGPCRRPLGRMTRQGVDKVVSAAKQVWGENPEIFSPIHEFFGIDVEARLNDQQRIEALAYPDYA